MLCIIMHSGSSCDGSVPWYVLQMSHVDFEIPAEDDLALPKELVWDYASAPNDLSWRLQRLAEWFPEFGRDRHSVKLLFRYRETLRIPWESRRLIELYEEAWREKELANGVG